VVAIERDRDLVPLLRAELASEIEQGKLELLEADAKQVDVAALLARGPAPRVLAGNLPYQLTGPLLEQAVHAARALDRACSWCSWKWPRASARSRERRELGSAQCVRAGAIRRSTRFHRAPRRFQPQPGVDSAVVVMEPLKQPIAVETDELRALVHAAFAAAAQKLKNAWRRCWARCNPAGRRRAQASISKRAAKRLPSPRTRACSEVHR
jgi:16S rRNA (adenine1518-N6/adenine1519-N6)-dimethyltransferase